MVKLLLAAGADLGAVGMSGETPLNLARRLGASELVGLLETAAASPRPDEPGAPRTETSGRTAAGPGTSPVTLAGVVVLGVVLTALLLYFLLRRTAAKETSRLQRFVETLRGLGFSQQAHPSALSKSAPTPLSGRYYATSCGVLRLHRAGVRLRPPSPSTSFHAPRAPERTTR